MNIFNIFSPILKQNLQLIRCYLSLMMLFLLPMLSVSISLIRTTFFRRLKFKFEKKIIIIKYEITRDKKD